jgi:hypothetical protein
MTDVRFSVGRYIKAKERSAELKKQLKQLNEDLKHLTEDVIAKLQQQPTDPECTVLQPDGKSIRLRVETKQKAPALSTKVVLGLMRSHFNLSESAMEQFKASLKAFRDTQAKSVDALSTKVVAKAAATGAAPPRASAAPSGVAAAAVGAGSSLSSTVSSLYA